MERLDNGKRSLKLGLGSVVATVAVLVVAVILGSLALRYHQRFDLSKQGKHTLAPQTIKVLETMKAPVSALAFYHENQMGKAQAESLLERYSYASKRFSYRFVDPDREPVLAKKHKISKTGSLVLLSGKRSETVKSPEEQSLTNALIRLGRQEEKTIYFLVGHGERGIQDQGKEGFYKLGQAVKAQNYRVKTLILATAPKVPGDAAMLVAAGPEKPLLEPEKQRLAQYLDQGGSLLLMMEPQRDAGLAGWLQKRGVIPGNDIVFDQASKLFGASPAWPISASFGQHAITAPLSGLFCYFPICRSVELAPKLPQGAKGVSLLKSSAQSWAEMGLEDLASGEVAYEEGKDRLGPISLAVSLSLPAPKAKKGAAKAAKGNLIVFGDSDFASNAHLDQVGNRDLILNTVSYLAEEEDLISIQAKSQGPETLMLQPKHVYLVFWLPVVVMPLFFVILGLVVYLRRRRPL